MPLKTNKTEIKSFSDMLYLEVRESSSIARLCVYFYFCIVVSENKFPTVSYRIQIIFK